MKRRSARIAVGLTLAVLTSACSAIRFGGDSIPDVAGEWVGSVSVEGAALDGTLTIVQSGEDLDVSFSAPSFGVTAEGEGEVEDDGSVWLELDYDLECPGVARFEGTFTDDATRLAGVLEASDCTGSQGGTFSFTRR